MFAACTQKCYGWFASLQQSVVFARAIIAIRRYFGERVSDVLSPHYSIVCCVATNIRSELARCVNKVSFLVERWIKIGLVRYKRGRAVALSDKNQLDDLGDFLTMRHHSEYSGPWTTRLLLWWVLHWWQANGSTAREVFPRTRPYRVRSWTGRNYRFSSLWCDLTGIQTQPTRYLWCALYPTRS